MIYRPFFPHLSLKSLPKVRVARDFFLRRVRVGNHAEHGQAELLLDVLGRADLAVEHGVSDDGADADEQAEHGHDGHDEHFARLDGLFGQGRLVDDLDLIRHHDLGDLRLFGVFRQFGVENQRADGIGLLQGLPDLRRERGF